MKLYRLVNTKNNYTLGIFSTEEKANEAFEELKKIIGAMNIIIFKEELDHIYIENTI